MSTERISYAGTHKARAAEFAYGKSNGNECIAVRFEFVGGPHEGKSIQWFGYFTPKTEDRTLESLRHAGWVGADMAALDGLGTTEVELAIADEEYDGKVRSKVQWVNRASRVTIKDQLDGNALQSFAARMRGKALASAQKYGAPATAPRSNGASKPQYHAEPEPGAMDFEDAPF